MARSRSRSIATGTALVLIGASLVAGTQAAFAAAPENQVTQLVSTGPNGENGGADEAVISADGSTVMFRANLDLHRPDESTSIFDYGHFVRDLDSGDLELVGEGVDGLVPDENLTWLRMSSTGQFAVFTSNATNLTAEDEGSVSQVYRWNRATGVNDLVSASTADEVGNSLSHRATISGDGRFVVFASFASNLVAGDTNGVPDLFLRDMQTGVTTRLLEDIEANDSDNRVAGDGETLAFSTAKALVPGDDNGVHDVYTLDFSSGDFTMVSVAADGAPGAGVGNSYFDFSISHDGSLVTFASAGSDFVAGDTNGVNDVFVRDMAAGTTTLVSRALDGGLADSHSSSGQISSNGRFVTFSSTATDLVDPSTSGGNIYVRDLVEEQTIWVGPVGEPNFGDSGWIHQSVSNGGLVAFMSYDGSLVDDSDDYRVFVRNVAPVITSGSAPTDVEVDEAYPGHTVTTTGSDKAFTPTFSISDGSLPPGLSLGASTGAITGTPTSDGTFEFTVTATTSAGSDSQALTITVLPTPVSVVEDPTIDGEPVVGGTLTADPGEWEPEGTTFSYQWLVDGVEVDGATSQTYSPQAADVGENVTVTVTGTAAGVDPLSATSAAVGPVVNGDLEGTVDFTGTLVFGQTLTASTTGWNGADLTFEWFADGVTTGTGATYVLDAGDIGTDITVQVTAELDGYNDGELLSAAQGPVEPATMVPGTPTVNDTTPEVGQVLTANAGTWSPSGITFAYRWLSNGSPIVGATNATYTVQAGDVGDTISVRVTGTKLGHFSGTATSAETSPVATDGITVERISGADRYAGAIAISQAAFPGTAPVVYVATGANYPDALSAAPAAVVEGAPLLLVPAGSIPSNILAEISRLDPEKIVVVGGTGVVSPTAFSQLQGIATTVRLAGNDRYETSRAVVDGAFDVADLAYVATGRNFPDALSASGAAGATSNPVVLLDGNAGQADQPTKNLLTELEVNQTKIVGGAAVVSNGIQSSLVTVAPVSRLGGDNRYVVSVNVNRDAFDSSEYVFLATGLNFPDALAGAAWAGKVNAPLYIVPGSCVPQDVLDDIDDLGATTVFLLGGTGVLTNEVMSLTPCAG